MGENVFLNVDSLFSVFVGQKLMKEQIINNDF